MVYGRRKCQEGIIKFLKRHRVKGITKVCWGERDPMIKFQAAENRSDYLSPVNQLT